MSGFKFAASFYIVLQSSIRNVEIRIFYFQSTRFIIGEISVSGAAV